MNAKKLTRIIVICLLAVGIWIAVSKVRDAHTPKELSQIATEEEKVVASSSNEEGGPQEVNGRMEPISNEVKQTKEEIISLRIEEIMNEMSLHDKICQLFVIYPEAIAGARQCWKWMITQKKQWRNGRWEALFSIRKICRAKSR